MPSAIAFPILAAGSALAGAGASVYGAKKAESATSRAQDLEQQAIDKQLAWEREQEVRRREEFDRTEAENKRRWGIEANRDEYRWGVNQSSLREDKARDVDLWNIESTRRQPYRDHSLAAVQELGKRAGLTINYTSAPQLEPPAAAPAPYAVNLADLAKYDAPERTA